MRFGFVYSRAWTYDLLLWVLYRGRPRERFRRVAEKVPPGSTVLDLCAGTSMLYRELSGRAADYTAVDVNPTLVRALRRRGITALCADVCRAELPAADVVVMCSSLYHFWPDAGAMLRRMLHLSRSRVIILEPVNNLSEARSSLLARFARWGSTVEGRAPDFHFSPESFTQLVKPLPGLVSLELLENRRDMLAVIAADQSGSDPPAPGNPANGTETS